MYSRGSAVWRRQVGGQAGGLGGRLQKSRSAPVSRDVTFGHFHSVAATKVSQCRRGHTTVKFIALACKRCRFFDPQRSRVGGSGNYSYHPPMCAHSPSFSPGLYRSSSESGRNCKWRARTQWQRFKSDVWKHFWFHCVKK